MFTSDNEESFLLYYIQPKHHVLEYGSGESTLQLSKLCDKIVTVEHQAEWYQKLKERLPDNCTSLYYPPNQEYVEGTDCGSMEQFFDYVHAPLSYAPFDIILIDGRARVACASLTKKLIRNQNSFIFIHDWNRVEYQEALNFLKLIDVCENMARFKVK